ncbi:MAG: protein phosphatase 2C domain-containing protein [Burkholderiales bacterium]|nr:MAG: protein phosphatase 2C domain-containing protein [Burkholderiales bacterium]
MSHWSVAAAATVGERHIADGRPCEDSWTVRLHHFQGEPWLILAVSDGAGTAGRAQAGSACAVAAFADEAARCLYADTSMTADRLRDCLGAARVALAVEAGLAQVPIRDFACTLLGAVIGPGMAGFVQVGDGAIVIAGDEPGSWAWMFEPQKGEYANETSFVTDQEALSSASVAVLRHVPAEIALFTDGLENLLIRTLPERHVVGRFFDQMFPPVRRASEAGLDQALCDHLGGYLATPQIAARSDDDRTLILASCLRETVAVAARESETCATP